MDCTGCYTTWQTHCARLQQRIHKRRTFHRLSSSTYSHFNSLLFETVYILRVFSPISTSEIPIFFRCYTNVPIQQGIASVKQALSEHTSATKNRLDKFILTLLELTLLPNDFQFNNKTDLQTKGTAMGKKYAPALC